MVAIWYMDAERGNHQSAPEEKEKSMTLEQLKEITGVECFQVDARLSEEDTRLSKLRSDGGYSYQDSMRLDRSTEDYEQRKECFCTEHFHTEEEIRLVVDGAGYFDVRDKEDKWIRIAVQKNDLLILPPRIFHRFFLTEECFVHLNRYFVGNPNWTATNRHIAA